MTLHEELVDLAQTENVSCLTGLMSADPESGNNIQRPQSPDQSRIDSPNLQHTDLENEGTGARSYMTIS